MSSTAPTAVAAVAEVVAAEVVTAATDDNLFPLFATRILYRIDAIDVRGVPFDNFFLDGKGRGIISRSP